MYSLDSVLLNDLLVVGPSVTIFDQRPMDQVNKRNNSKRQIKEGFHKNTPLINLYLELDFLI